MVKNKLNRMLKKAISHPPRPKRAKTRPIPSFLLGSQTILNVPLGKSRSRPTQGEVGEKAVRLRWLLRLRPCWQAFLNILKIRLQSEVEP